MKPEWQDQDKVEQAISALLACPRVEDAARQCGVSRTTLWRMSQDPDFKLRLQEARTRLSEQIVISLQANTLEAGNTLRSIMLDKKTSPSMRISTAGKLTTSHYAPNNSMTWNSGWLPSSWRCTLLAKRGIK